MPVFLNSPTNVQRRLAEGAWVMIVVLVFIGIESQGGLLNKLVPPIIMTISLPATLILILGGVMTAWSPQEPVFIHSELGSGIRISGRE